MSKKLYQQFCCSKMMLPEHRRELQKQEHDRRQEEETRLPLFDEQQLELWDRMLSLSLQQKIALTITYRSGEECRTVKGVITAKRSRPAEILLSCGEELLKIPIPKISGMDIDSAGW